MFQHRPGSLVKCDIALFIACRVHQSCMTFLARSSELMLPKKLPKKEVAHCQVMSAFSSYINKVTEWWGLATGTRTPSGSSIFIRLLTLFTCCLFQANETRQTRERHRQTWKYRFFFFLIPKGKKNPQYLHLKLKLLLLRILGLRLNIRSDAGFAPRRVRWGGSGILLGCLPGEVFRARFTGRRPPGWPRTRWRDYVFHLAWERLWIPSKELDQAAEEREVWASLLRLLPPPPDPR